MGTEEKTGPIKRVPFFDLSLAISLAATAHGDARDKGGKIYILHPLRVMLSMETEEEMIVAVLHDVVEDTEITMDFIRKNFPERIADAMDAISRRDGESYFDYIHRVAKNELAKKVKLADLRDNISPARIAALPELERKISKRYEEALEILG